MLQAAPSLSLSCPWLSRSHTTRLKHHLLTLHEEQGGGVILFTWLSFLQEETLPFLGMDDVISLAELCEEEVAEDTTPAGQLAVERDVQAAGSSKSVQDTCDYVVDEWESHTSHEEKPAEKNISSEKKEMHRRYSVRTHVGTVKKWKQLNENNGHGFIKMSDGRELSFHSRDCLNLPENEGVIFFKKGDKVTFDEQTHGGVRKHHTTTTKAVNVTYYLEDGISTEMESVNSRVDNEIVISDEIPCKNLENQNTSVPEKKITENEQKVEKTNVKSRKKASRRQKLVTLFREFDQMKKEEVFSSSLQSCDICFTDKVSVRLSDITCLASHWPLLRSGPSVSSLWDVITCTAGTVCPDTSMSGQLLIGYLLQSSYWSFQDQGGKCEQPYVSYR